MPRSNVPSALIASLLIGVGLCAGFLIGHFSQGRYTLTNAAFHRGQVESTRLGEYDFQRYGRYSTHGKVIRIWTETQEGDVPGLPHVLVVSDIGHPERGHGAYEVFQDRGIVQVMVRGEPIRFTVLAVLNKAAIADVVVDDEVTLAGDYGEIHYPSGSSGSLADMGLFVCSVADVQRTRQ